MLTPQDHFVFFKGLMSGWPGMARDEDRLMMESILAVLKQRCGHKRHDGPNVPWDRVERRKDNWTSLVNEYTSKYNFKYTDWQGEELTFFGLVDAEDDLYYGLTDKDGKVRLASCVGALDGENGWYKQIPNGGRCDLCNCVYPVSGPEMCDRYRCPQGDYPLDATGIPQEKTNGV